jgi:hypothetical protein
MSLKKFKEKLKLFSVTQLVFLPLWLGMLLVCFWTLSTIFYKNSILDMLMFNIVFLIFGCSGIPIVVYKELPAPWHSKGITAVVDGLLIILGCWIVPILTIFAFIRNLTDKFLS